MAESLPLFPLGTVLFPGMLLPLHIFEERYRELMRDRQGSDPIFGVVLTRQGREVADTPQINGIGTAATLVAAGRYPDGRYDLVVRGGRRFRVLAEEWGGGYLVAEVEWLGEPAGSSPESNEIAGLVAEVDRRFERFLEAFELATAMDLARESLPEQPNELAYALCARLPLDTWERQTLLEAPSDHARLAELATILRRERDLLMTTGVGGATVANPGAHFTAN
ncbi:MAG: LON peptidase substrate-binding domain-containing protein [Chloroflexia bacterium]|nr:LON peptidase substrate-binding domain-containing protein [Chloroflexia bacterium]